MFKSGHYHSEIVFLQEFGHIPFLLMQFSIRLILTFVLCINKIIRRYNLFAMKEKTIHDIRKYIIVISQYLFANIFFRQAPHLLRARVKLYYNL